MARYLRRGRRPARRQMMRRRRTFRRGLKQPGTPRAPRKALPSRSPGKAAKRMRKERVDHSALGQYTGKFNKPRRFKRIKRVDLEGIQDKNEVTIPSVAEDDCAYVGMSSHQPYRLYTQIWAAFLRKYMKIVWNADLCQYSDIPFVIGANTISVRFDFVRNDGISALTNLPYTTNYVNGSTTVALTHNASPSFGDLVSLIAAAFYNLWVVSNEISLKRFELSIGEDITDLRNKLNVDNMYVSVKSVATIRLQNTTTSDTGAETTDQITNNPIMGKIYKFSSPAPLLRTGAAAGTAENWSNISELRTVPAAPPAPQSTILLKEAGVVWPYWANGAAGVANAIEIAKTVEFVRPPAASVFTNCNGVVSFSLEPGEIRHLSKVFIFKGQFTVLMEDMLRQYCGRVDGQRFGTSVVFAFAKRMPTGTAKVRYNVCFEWRSSALVRSRAAVFKSNVGLNTITTPPNV